ncbi:hypothetical protein BDY19DRAFT_308877 [Irpex rosettiformis]|uniref:Uncharacterized protein n=1 Tax=Irpex rosettiformis TaxID=378272 RepID=A0ACB8TZ00_9APHY|nr:hypothetical protein BDY19DRAFT_308877 [Irpex rosettiformis]
MIWHRLQEDDSEKTNRTISKKKNNYTSIMSRGKEEKSRKPNVLAITPATERERRIKESRTERNRRTMQCELDREDGKHSGHSILSRI